MPCLNLPVPPCSPGVEFPGGPGNPSSPPLPGNPFKPGNPARPLGPREPFTPGRSIPGSPNKPVERT